MGRRRLRRAEFEAMVFSQERRVSCISGLLAKRVARVAGVIAVKPVPAPMPESHRAEKQWSSTTSRHGEESQARISLVCLKTGR